MEEQIRQIAERMKGLREVLELSVEEVAHTCGIPVEKYLEYESGKIDIPVSVLHRISQQYGVELTVLLTGQEPHMHRYSLVRKNKGVGVERSKAYDYKSLAYSFINRKAEPFLVTVEPKENEAEVSYNTHPGQEFNYVLEGRLKICLGEKEMILEQGDSIYFDSSLPHRMYALDRKPCRFIAIIL
jgi:mannose-6-phosphate isomerase-like protein (cupin superfamily)